MKILFLTKHFYPRIGGVENQVFELSKRLIKKGIGVTVITEKFDDSLKSEETFEGITIKRFSVPKAKYLGLIFVWFWLLLHSNVILKSDIIHTHGVFIWYWPFRLFFFWKKAYTTFHGWEGIYPIPLKNKLIKKIDAHLANGNIAIHDYLEKWYGIKAGIISYTAADVPKRSLLKKDYKRLVYIGRLDEDTGLRIILEALKKLDNYKIDFCGDGPLKNECANYGKVHGFTDPKPFLEKAFICLSPGVTTILEAFSFKCLVVTTFNNPLKKDYLLMTPFKNWIFAVGNPKVLAEEIKYYSLNPKKAKDKINNSYEWVKTQNWDNEVRRYYRLWSIKSSST